MAHSPIEPLLAIATEELEIELLRTDSWKASSRLSGHTQGVLCVAFSPDGKTLASGSLDRSVRLWHVPTGQELLSFQNLPGQINGVAFSADGRTLAATCHDGSVRMWHAMP
jgi:WD40 repeat protein